MLITNALKRDIIPRELWEGEESIMVFLEKIFVYFLLNLKRQTRKIVRSEPRRLWE